MLGLFTLLSLNLKLLKYIITFLYPFPDKRAPDNTVETASYFQTWYSSFSYNQSICQFFSIHFIFRHNIAIQNVALFGKLSVELSLKALLLTILNYFISKWKTTLYQENSCYIKLKRICVFRPLLQCPEVNLSCSCCRQFLYKVIFKRPGVFFQLLSTELS